MTSLAAYIIRRLLFLIFVLIGVTVLIFLITMLFSPEIRALLYIRNPQRYNADEVRIIIEKYGLNDPFYMQYGRWLNEVLHGNLGYSFSTSEMVQDALVKRWPYTFQIVLFAAPLIIFVGIFLGVQSAVHRDSVIDHASRILSIVGWSLPSFWLGLLLLSLFYGRLGWLPPGGISHEAQLFIDSNAFVRYTHVDMFDGILNGQLWVTVDALKHVILPVIVIVIIDVALLIRVMRSSMLETLGKPYIISARAKGLKEKVVIYRHARRNALIPVATLSGMLVAGLLGGLVITETVFGVPGLGSFAATAALQLDIAAVLGYAGLTALMFVTANLIVDVLYAYIDPRIRLE